MSENLSPAQIRSNPHQFFPEVVRSLLAEDEHPLPEIVTPLDVETVWRVPRSSQKKQRALGTFAPHFRVGRRVYYRRAAIEQWIAQQERASQGAPTCVTKPGLIRTSTKRFTGAPASWRIRRRRTAEQMVLLRAVFSHQSGGG